MEITTLDFTWFKDPNGYLAEGKKTRGFYGYVGDSTKVFIPEKINGTTMKSYYKMFTKGKVRATKKIRKVITNNPHLENIDYMFEGVSIEKLNLNEMKISNVRSAKGMFKDALIDELDIRKIDTSNLENMSEMFCNFGDIFYNKKYTIIGIENINTSNVTDMSYMFSNCKASNLNSNSNFEKFNTSKVVNMEGLFSGKKNNPLKIDNLNLRSFNTSSVRNMSKMFKQSILRNLDLKSLNTSNVEDVSEMFSYCKFLKFNASDLKLHNVKNMDSMFEGIESEILDLSNIDLSNVKSMIRTFSHVSRKDLILRNLNVSNVKNISEMFLHSNISRLLLENLNFSNLTTTKGMFKSSEIDNVYLKNTETSNVKDMSEMFKESFIGNFSSISFNTSNVENMSEMFCGINSHIKMDLNWLNTSSVVNMSGMFSFSNFLKLDISSLCTSNVVDMSRMFENTYVNKSLDISKFDTSKVKDISKMFYGALANIHERSMDKFNFESLEKAEKVFDCYFDYSLWRIPGSIEKELITPNSKITIRGQEYTLFKTVDSGYVSLFIHKEGNFKRLTKENFYFKSENENKILFERAIEEKISIELDCKFKNVEDEILEALSNAGIRVTIEYPISYRNFTFEKKLLIDTSKIETIRDYRKTIERPNEKQRLLEMKMMD